MKKEMPPYNQFIPYSDYYNRSNISSTAQWETLHAFNTSQPLLNCTRCSFNTPLTFIIRQQ